MKKIASTCIAVLGLGVGGMASAIDGTISITGEVSGKTCKISGGSGDQTVTLVPVSQSSLGAGATSGFKPFSISVDSCTAGTKIVAHFEPGPTVNHETGNLVNQAAGGSNVEVQILTKDQKPIHLVNGTNNQEVIATGESGKATGTLEFLAAYKAPDSAAATPGAVSTSVQYTMSYE
ncbi:type 1 fimbrial protein [Metapseudomonas lalkuanensis]|uniref:Type 1 fimbrial protein n=1 Tax=Metapseudomonas lalkuanensis TaxID=2604832 RepID=A0A5J6QEZ5_9GAMM|nr:fimbrial protein [Pseudomonas lalkuanensis]QEY60883.1 type 1 fimbrial protein [Pseudomonas lalkuanensis]UCO98617.1 type 1 fimbrial protein [Pseudomonas lalkuanensis]